MKCAACGNVSNLETSQSGTFANARQVASIAQRYRPGHE